MNLKNPLSVAVLVAAANLATAQDIPAPRHVSEQILATNKPRADGSNSSWPALAYSNVSWRKRVWRDIDVKAKGNEIFKQEKNDHSLLNTLAAGVMSGKIKAYRDEIFSQELSVTELALRLKILADKEPWADQRLVSKYQVKEDSLGLRDEDGTEVRIVGIAPMVEQSTVNGITIETTDIPIFWVYYIDALNYLAESPSVKSGFTWADVLESHSFNGTTSRENLKMTNSPVAVPPAEKQ